MMALPVAARVSDSVDQRFAESGSWGNGSDRSSALTRLADGINSVRMWIEYPAVNGYFSPECSGNVRPTVP
jgi:hypothetical protein